MRRTHQARILATLLRRKVHAIGTAPWISGPRPTPAGSRRCAPRRDRPTVAAARRAASADRARISATAEATASGSRSRFVPWVMVIGRSVLGRTVRHGMPRIVVSSWMPPGIGDDQRRAAHERHERRRTQWLDDPQAIARLEAGPLQRPARRAGGAAGSRSLLGHAVEHRDQRPRPPRAVSTLAGRWSVATAYGPSGRGRRAQRRRRNGRGSPSSVSIIGLPTKCMRSSGTPSRRRLSIASGLVTKHRSTGCP